MHGSGALDPGGQNSPFLHFPPVASKGHRHVSLAVSLPSLVGIDRVAPLAQYHPPAQIPSGDGNPVALQ